VADEHWNSVATYSDRPSAEATLGLLLAEGLPCFIASDEHVPGLGSSFAVRVPSALLHRARWMLERVQVSEAELNYLATGRLGGEPGRD
jgi:hypothetical protein